MIMHDSSSFDIKNYYSDILDSNTGIWWYCDYDEITQISDFIEGIYTRENINF